MRITTDWKTPGTVTSEVYEGSSNVWTTPSNAMVSDDIFTTSSVFGAGLTQALYCSNFNFGIPAGMRLSGIEIQVEYKYSGSIFVSTSGAQILVNLSAAGKEINTLTSWPLTKQTLSIGSASNNWGIPYLGSDTVNSSTFGVAFAGFFVGLSAIASVDVVRMRLTYDYMRPLPGILY